MAVIESPRRTDSPEPPTPPHTPSPPRRQLLKRIVVGRAKTTGQIEHTLLPKLLALPVFSSDALSSVAYATEEAMVVLIAAGAASLGLVMPIAIAISLVMAIVIT